MVNHMMKRIFLLLALISTTNAWGAYSPGTFIVDPTGTNAAQVKAASTAAGATDPALVVAISPNNSIAVGSSALPTGASTSALQTTANTSLASILAALPASLGQKTMAGSLACVLPSDQSAIPVTGTFWQATQPVSAASLPLPTGAATSANQTNASQKTQLVDGSGNVIGSTSNALNVSVISGGGSNASVSATGSAVPASATFIGANKSGTMVAPLIDASGNFQMVVSEALPAGTNLLGKVGIDQTTPGTTNLVSIGTSGTVQTKAPLNSTGSGSAAAATVSTVITLTAPSNAVGAFLMNLDTSSANVRWAVNRTASATLGQQLQPGRDAWIPTTTNISLCAENGTQNYDVQWISQ